MIFFDTLPVMEKRKSTTNPFYPLLVVLGLAFVVTACAFGVMAFRDISILGEEPDSDGGLIGFMTRHGMTLLGVEVVLLGTCTVAAIGTDQYWQRRNGEDVTP